MIPDFARVNPYKADGEDILESDHIVTGLDGSHTLADRLDNTGTLVAQDDRESTLGVLAGQSVGV